MTWSSAKPPNSDFVDIVEDLELRGSSAEAQNLDFVDSFEDRELREASGARFRRQLRGFRAPQGARLKFACKIPPLNPYPHICILDARWGAEAPHLARVSAWSSRPEIPRSFRTLISSRFLDDLELRDSSDVEAKAPHLAPVSALSARLGAP